MALLHGFTSWLYFMALLHSFTSWLYFKETKLLLASFRPARLQFHKMRLQGQFLTKKPTCVREKAKY